MTKQEKSSAFSRRSVLLGGGALVVSMGAPIGFDTVLGINAAFAQGTKPPLTPDQLSSYIAVNANVGCRRVGAKPLHSRLIQRRDGEEIVAPRVGAISGTLVE